MIYKIERKGITISEDSLHIPENTKFYKVIDRGEGFADYCIVAPYRKKDIRRINYALSASVYNIDNEEFIGYIKYIRPKGCAFPETLFPQICGKDKYVAQYVMKDEEKVTLKVYKLIRFTGKGFFTFCAQWIKNDLNTIVPGIFAEEIELPLLFRFQKEMETGNEGSIYSEFVSKETYDIYVQKVKSYLDING